MKKLFVTVSTIALIASFTAVAETKAEYVGLGKFSCQGNSTQCAQIDSNNRQQQERSDNEYRRSQDAANAYVDRERRKDEERRNEQRRN